MRAAIGFIFVLVLASNVFAQTEEETRTVFQLNENRGFWYSSGSPKKEGGQNYIYFSLAHIGSKYGVTFLGAHADTSYIYNGGRASDFHLGTLLDSTISGFYKLEEVSGFGLRTGLDINLPTGTAGFTNSELNALFLDRVGQELNLVSSFGRGLNLAPNLVATRSLEKVTLGLGMRYEMQGKYDPTKDIAGDDYDPGNLLMLIGTGLYRPSEGSLFMADLSSVMSTRDRQGGQDVFKLGTVYSLEMRYAREYEVLKATYYVSYSMQEKNQSYGSGGITTEDRNSNSNLYHFFVNLRYPWAEQLGINGIAGYKDVMSNSYSSGDPLYDGGYTKLYVGGGATFTVSERFFWRADMRISQINNRADDMEPGGATYTGVNVDIGFVYTFLPDKIQKVSKGEN